MATNRKNSDLSKLEKMNLSKETIPKYNSKTIKKSNRQNELYNINTKKSYRNTFSSLGTGVTRLNSDLISYYQENTGDYDDLIRRKYLFIISKYEKIIEELSNINKKLEENNQKIEELNNGIVKLKEDKKQKQSDIVNYLAKKESLEEIFKNKINYLVKSRKEAIAKSELIDINLNLESLKNNNNSDIDYFNMDEEKEIEITIEDIKKSDKSVFNQQVINFAEEILNKKDNEDLSNKIKSKINIAYNIFFSEISSNSMVNLESVVSHFFSRIALYISNNSLGNYSELNVNKFLRYLLKINSINIEVSNILKFLNKKYKEQKSEMRKKLIILNKRNEDLKERKINYEKKSEEYEKIIEKNKEYKNNLKQNKIEDKNEKKKYMNNTLDRLYFQKGANNLKLLMEENPISHRGHIKPSINTQYDDFENFKKYVNTERMIESNKNKNDNNINKVNKENLEENKNKGKKSILITKNTKIILKKSGKQIKVKNYIKDKGNKNINNTDNDIVKDSESDKNKSNDNSINQNYIVIKNDININNNKDKDRNRNKTDIISNNNRVKKPSTSVSNNIVKKVKPSNNIQKDKNQKNDKDKNMINDNKNIEENEKNLLYNRKSVNHQKAKYNKNIYIINNINNSQQIETKNNIYANKSQNLHINTTGSLNFDNYDGKFNRTNRSINNNEIYIGNNNGNNQLIKINNNNNYQNNYNTQEKEIKNKNKTNYNFHDILNVNSLKNNKSFLLTSIDNTRTDKNIKIENTSNSPTYSSKNLDNKKKRTFQKNSYDYKSSINKNNNINNDQNLYKKANDNNVVKKTYNANTFNGGNNKNYSFKETIYSKKKDK